MEWSDEEVKLGQGLTLKQSAFMLVFPDKDIFEAETWHPRYKISPLLDLARSRTVWKRLGVKTSFDSWMDRQSKQDEWLKAYTIVFQGDADPTPTTRWKPIYPINDIESLQLSRSVYDDMKRQGLAKTGFDVWMRMQYQAGTNKPELLGDELKDLSQENWTLMKVQPDVPEGYFQYDVRSNIHPNTVSNVRIKGSPPPMSKLVGDVVDYIKYQAERDYVLDTLWVDCTLRRIIVQFTFGRKGG